MVSGEEKRRMNSYGFIIAGLICLISILIFPYLFRFEFYLAFLICCIFFTAFGFFLFLLDHIEKKKEQKRMKTVKVNLTKNINSKNHIFS